MRVNQFPLLPREIGEKYRLSVQDFASQHAAAISKAEEQAFIVACSDETTALTTGVAKVTFRFPWSFQVSGVRASLSTAQSSGSLFTVDININTNTMLSTKLTIDNSEKTSKTAATAAVISVSTIVEDDEITIDIDQVGTGAKGLKVTFMGVRT